MAEEGKDTEMQSISERERGGGSGVQCRLVQCKELKHWSPLTSSGPEREQTLSWLVAKKCGNFCVPAVT